MTEPIKKKYLIELSEADMDLLDTALSEVQDHCEDNGQALYTVAMVVSVKCIVFLLGV